MWKDCFQDGCHKVGGSLVSVQLRCLSCVWKTGVCLQMTIIKILNIKKWKEKMECDLQSQSHFGCCYTGEPLSLSDFGESLSTQTACLTELSTPSFQRFTTCDHKDTTGKKKSSFRPRRSFGAGKQLWWRRRLSEKQHFLSILTFQNCSLQHVSGVRQAP